MNLRYQKMMQNQNKQFDKNLKSQDKLKPVDCSNQNLRIKNYESVSTAPHSEQNVKPYMSNMRKDERECENNR